MYKIKIVFAIEKNYLKNKFKTTKQQFLRIYD